MPLLSIPMCTDRYRPTLPVDQVKTSLGFASLEDCTAFLTGLEVTYTAADESKIDCKASAAKMQAI